MLFAITSNAQQAKFPEADWEVATPESTQVNSEKLKAWVDYTFTDLKKRKTDALILVHQGKVIFEKYKIEEGWLAY